MAQEQILTRTALTPEMLERQYKYKVEIREFTASVQREQLVPALREVSFSATSRSYDLRTAVLLYDKSGKRMLSLYFDRSGRNAVVNNSFLRDEPGSRNASHAAFSHSAMPFPAA